MAFISVNNQELVKNLINEMYLRLPQLDKENFNQKIEEITENILNVPYEKKTLCRELELFAISTPHQDETLFHLVGWGTILRELNLKHNSLKTMLSMSKNNVLVTRHGVKLVVKREHKAISFNDLTDYDTDKGCLLRYLISYQVIDKGLAIES